MSFPTMPRVHFDEVVVGQRLLFALDCRRRTIDEDCRYRTIDDGLQVTDCKLRIVNPEVKLKKW